MPTGKYTAADVAPGRYTAADVAQPAAQPNATATGDGSDGTDNQGPLDELAAWGAKTFPRLEQPTDLTHTATYLTPGANVFRAGVRTLTGLPAAAADWFEQAKDIPNEVMHPIDSMRQRLATDAENPGTVIKPGDEIASPSARDLAGYGEDVAGGILAGGVVGKSTEGALHLPDLVKSVIRGPVDEPMAGMDITPRERYAAAKARGVNLGVTQATNSPWLKPLDWLNEGGILSGPVRQKANAANVDALTNFQTDHLRRMSPFDPETGGKAIQDPLRSGFVNLQDRTNDALGEMSPMSGMEGGARLKALASAKQQSLHDEASKEYDDIADNFGDYPANGVPSIVKTAEDIGKKNSRFGQQFPSLENRRLAGVIGDAAQLGNESQATYLGQPTVADLMRARSGLLDLIRDPEIVKSSYGGDIQRLIAVHDQAVMDSLPEEGRDVLRNANAKWDRMKGTFDNPSNPFYHAVRTDNPSSLVEGIGGTSPESMKTLRDITGKEGAGIVARGVGEKLLGRNAEGMYDLRNLGAPFQRMGDETRAAVFGPSEETLQRIGSDYREMQPFERAAYTGNPEELIHGTGLGPKTAAGVRKLRDLPIKPEGAFGPPAPRIGPAGMGALQRGNAEDLLGKTPEGRYNLKLFPNNLAQLNEGYRDELFGPEHQTLKDTAHVAKALDVDYNRSASGKTFQKVLEVSGFGTPLPYLQYPLAKILTSPKVADWMMEPSSHPNAFFAPAAAAATVKSSRRAKDQ